MRLVPDASLAKQYIIAFFSREDLEALTGDPPIFPISRVPAYTAFGRCAGTLVRRSGAIMLSREA
eukprot:8313008-Pyramimonas_sp.AAC.1